MVEEPDPLEREPWRSIFEIEATGRYLFHYTRLSTAIEKILPDRRFRFSRLSSMRDPRESQWAFASSFFGDVPDGDRLYWEVFAKIQAAQSHIRLLSLTADDESNTSVFGRGYARPRLWEQYAGSHMGVCLCFDKQLLIDAVENAVGAVQAKLIHRRVTYRDGPIATHARVFDLQEAHARGADSLADEHTETHLDELVFTKLVDWETEFEYRLVTRWDSPDELFADVSEALKAVAVGHAASRAYAPTLNALCDPDVGVARLWWENGRPWVYKFTAAPR